MNHNKKFVIFGHKRHGKDTVCEYLEKRFGLTFISSSEYACDKFLFDELKDQFNYTNKEECFADRYNHRKIWYECIKAYNTPNLSRLGRELFSQYDIYCGIRDLEEFNVLVYEGLVDLSIFIDASERKELESSESMKLSKRDADIIIENNGDLSELYIKIDRLFIAMGYKLL